MLRLELHQAASTSSSSASLDSSLSYVATLGDSRDTSIESMTSAPCTKKKGVSYVELFGVLRKLHNTDGNSSTHAPFALSSGATNLFLGPAVTSPVAFSTYPFVCR